MKQRGYSGSAVIIHWLLALSIFFLFVSSWWMLGLPLVSKGLTFRHFPFQLHKHVGITVALMLVLLLYVRLRHRPAALPRESMPSWMHKLATADHIVLYGVIFVCCASGYLSSAYSGYPTSYWWLIKLPMWAEGNKDLNLFWSDVHLWATWVLLALISVHIAGALYHAFRDDGIIRRMLKP